MSNWLIFRKDSQPAHHPKDHRGKTWYFLLSLALVVAGAWFIWLILDVSGIPIIDSDAGTSSASSFSAFSPSVQYWEDEILTWAETYALDPYLIATVMQIESCGNPHAASPAGAQGLFQVMPYHFSDSEDMLDPETNALRGLTYLSQAFEKAGGNIERTFAGYNGGHGQIDLPERDWPEETRHYVIWGTGIYQDASGNDTAETTLDLWLNAGGSQLCREAERILGMH